MSARYRESVMVAPEPAGSAPPFEEPRHQVYVFPGQVFASARPTRVTTILGSCIAVCLFDPMRRFGGMNHFMLPHNAGHGTATARFGNIAMAELFDKFTAAGSRLASLEARIFGGSCMFAAMDSAGHLGQRNEQLAREALAARGIRILDADTGGARGRKLVFHTDEGKTWLTSI